MTKIAAMGGAKIEAVDTVTAVPVSIVEIIGFPKPAVVDEDAKRPVALAPFIAVAVPPPAIMAKDQVTTGSKSTTVETITAVPAIPARGIAKVSKRLSTQGMKYPKISTRVATPKVTKAGMLPIHCQLSLSSHAPRYAAILRAKRGKKTRNPTEAAKPTPKKILIIVSGVIFMPLTKVGYSQSRKKSSLNPMRNSFSLARVTAVYNQRR